MKRFLLMLLFLVLSTSAVSAAPIIRADKQFFDTSQGLYVLKGNVYVEVGNRIITANEAKVSLSSLEVMANGGINLTQGDIIFSGDSVYVQGSLNKATISGVSFARTGLNIMAGKAEFNWKTKIATFSEDVLIKQNGKEWSADILQYNVATNQIIM